MDIPAADVGCNPTNVIKVSMSNEQIPPVNAALRTAAAVKNYVG